MLALYKSSEKQSYIGDIFVLTGILAFIFFLFLDTYPLIIPDEGNYAEIAREMWVSKNYITPTLNEIKFFEKPILLYWIGILFFKMFGFSLWSLRACHGFMALIICLYTYGIGRYIFNRLTGIFAALMLATSGLYFMLAHMYTTDMTVTFFLTVTFYNFWLSVNVNSRKLAAFLFITAAFFAGCAVLAKGLIGIILPVFICLTWITLTKQWHVLKNFIVLFGASIVFMLTVIPWHALIALENPEFLRFYFIEHHLTRFQNGSIGHLQPFWYYLPVLVLGFFPWIMFLVQAVSQVVKKIRHNSPNLLFLMAWSLGVLVFFTISKAKLIPYILPALPPLGLIVGNYLSENLNKPLTKGIQGGFIFIFIIGISIACFIWIFPRYGEVNDLAPATFYLKSASLILAAGICGTFILYKKNVMKAFFLLVFTLGVFNLTLVLALPAVDTLNISSLTKILTAELKDDDEIIAFNHHYQDLAFYLNRRVMILNSRKLFSFGMKHQAKHDWMIDDNVFKNLWQSNKRIFAIISKKDLAKLDPTYQGLIFYIWGKNHRHVLVSNINDNKL